MRIRIATPHGRFLIVDRLGMTDSSLERPLDTQQALRFATRFLSDADSRARLEAQVRRDGNKAGPIRDFRAWLLSEIERGRIYLLALPERGSPGPSKKDDESPAPERETDSWVIFRVIWEDTGAPVPNVELIVTTSDETEHALRTNDEGEVRIDGTPPGPVQIKSPEANAKRETSLRFAGLGAPSQVVEVEPDEEQGLGPYQILALGPYAPSMGDNLESFAAHYGVTMDRLCDFNWQTTDPAEVAKRLRFEVGCSPSKSGEVVFRGDEEPGALWVPRPWSEKSQELGTIHTIRVEKPLARIAVFLEDPFLGPLVEQSVAVTYANGSKESLTTTPDGILEVAIDRWSEAGNFADLEFKTELKEYKLRIFLVLEPATTVAGAWQRLVNLGYVDTIEPPGIEPTDLDGLARSLETFQAHFELSPTGDLDADTASQLAQFHASAMRFVDSASMELDEPLDEDCAPKDAIV